MSLFKRHGPAVCKKEGCNLPNVPNLEKLLPRKIRKKAKGFCLEHTSQFAVQWRIDNPNG